MSSRNNRISRKINLSKRVLILCEGESEKIYVNGYRTEESNRRRLSNVEVEIYQPKDYSPYGLLQEAKRKSKEAKKDKMPYHSIWIIFDRDGHANIPKTFEEAQDVQIRIIFSSICFETWILLHFEQRKHACKNYDELQKYISKKKYLNYDKTNYYTYLSETHKQNAKENAKWLHGQNTMDIERNIPIYELNPYTNFDELMDYLEQLK